MFLSRREERRLWRGSAAPPKSYAFPGRAPVPPHSGQEAPLAMCSAGCGTLPVPGASRTSPIGRRCRHFLSLALNQAHGFSLISLPNPVDCAYRWVGWVGGWNPSRGSHQPARSLIFLQAKFLS